MKNYLASTIAATGLIIFIFGMDSVAQTATRAMADIPFDFYVGTELLPKGQYEFQAASIQTYPSSLIIRPVMKSPRRAMIVATIAHNTDAREDGFSLVFNQYGSVHYLSSISTGPGGLALRLIRTSLEKQLAKRFEQPSPVAIRSGDTAGN